MAIYVRIRPGMRFWHDDQQFSCLSISESSATVQCQSTRDVTIDTPDGSTRSFVARSGRTTHLASNASVVEVTE
jgi:hypothetical protein